MIADLAQLENSVALAPQLLVIVQLVITVHCKRFSNTNILAPLARPLQLGQTSQLKQTAVHLALQANTVERVLMLQTQRFVMQHFMFVQQRHQGQPVQQAALQNLEALLQQALDVLLVRLEASVLEMDQLIFVKWVTLQLQQVPQHVH
jgi:hypothetical protein